MSEGGGQALNFVYLLGVLVLVGSAVASQRIPISQSLKIALAWVLIFGAVFVLVLLKDDFASLGRYVLNQARGDGQVVEQAGAVRVRKAEDGHFWVTAKLNGEDTEFLVDSGATVTSISAETAERVGIEPEDRFPAVVDTANGIIKVLRGRADRIEVGTITRRNMAVHISDVSGPTNVLGMNFLSTLSAWGVEGQWLVLKP